VDLTFPLTLPQTQHGVVAHLYYTDRERVLTLTEIAGYTWVRQQIQWKDIEGPEPGDYKWGELDDIVDDVAARNLNLLISIVKAPSFYNPTNGLPRDPVTMGNFVEAMVRRYGTKIKAIEIWNEQNLAVENGGRVTVEDAGHYVEILVECYKRIKAVEPRIFVLAGAPSSSGVDEPSLAVSDERYYRAMYEYKGGLIKDYFDAQAVHPGGAAQSSRHPLARKAKLYRRVQTGAESLLERPSDTLLPPCRECAQVYDRRRGWRSSDLDHRVRLGDAE
jgi:hypothetical protein